MPPTKLERSESEVGHKFVFSILDIPSHPRYRTFGGMKHRALSKRDEMQAVEHVREIVFGVEDSLVSTLGTITGIAAGTGDTFVILLSASVLIIVEATSMAAGSYLSAKAADEVELELERERGNRYTNPPYHPVRGACVMWGSYFFAGFIPTIPYVLLGPSQAAVPSVVLTTIALFVLGVWVAKHSHRSVWRGGLEMVIVSLAAAALGYGVGRLVSLVLPFAT